MRINNSIGSILGESVDEDEDEDAVFYEDGEKSEEDDDYDIDEDN